LGATQRKLSSTHASSSSIFGGFMLSKQSATHPLLLPGPLQRPLELAPQRDPATRATIGSSG